MGMDSVFKVSLVLGMIDNITSKVDSVSNSVQSSVGGMTRAFDNMEKAGLAMTGVGTTIAGACLSTVTATFDTQDALGELASLGVEDLGAVEAAAKSFSDTWAGTAKSDFITAAYDIKSGIASLTDEGVAQFTELAALTGKATKSTTEEMGSLFATGYGIYKDFYGDMSDMEFGEMFSAGISTAVRLYKTSGTQMAEAIGKLGATATNANVPMEEQLAILGQLQTTMGGSEAATKYNAFLQSAAGAGKKLGLTFTDANNQLLSTPDILDKLKSKYGETLDAVEKQELKEAFGTDEAIKYIDLLYGKTDVLRSGTEELYASMEDGIAVTEGMAEAINNTPAQKFEVLKQKLHNTVEELGSGLLPAVNTTLDSVNNLVQKGSDWISNNQELVSTIMNIVMYLGLFLIGAGALTAVVGTAGKAFLSLKGIFKGVKTALSGIGFLSALGPIAIIAAAVIGLVAAFEYCGGDITKLQGIFQKVFSSVGGIVSGALNAVAAYLPGFLEFGSELLQSIVSGIMERLPSLLESGTTMILSLSSGIAAYLPTVTQMGVELLDSFLSMILAGLPGLLSGGVSIINSILQGIRMMLPSIADSASQLILGLLSALVAALPSLASMGSDLVNNLLQGILQLLPIVIQSGTSLLLNLLQGIIQQVPMLVQSGITLVLQLLSGIEQNMPALLSAGGQLIMNILTGIIQLLPNLISGGFAIIGNLVSGIIQGLPSVISIAGDIVKTIWEAITGTDWLALGGDMISGITDGFMSGFSSLVDSVKGAWDSFKNWLSGGGDDEIELVTPTQTVSEVSTPSTPTTVQSISQPVAAEPVSVIVPQIEIDTSVYEQAGMEGMSAFTSGLEIGSVDAQLATEDLITNMTAGMGESSGNLQAAAQQAMADLTAGISAGTEGAQLATGTSMDNIVSDAQQSAAQMQTAWRSGMNAVNSTVASGMDTVRSTAVSKTNSIVTSIKSAFLNMKVRIPAPALPHVSVSYSTVGSGKATAQVPNFSVAYHAAGGIMTRPTLFAVDQSGQGHVGGEAGAEAILPLDMLWSKMREVVGAVIGAHSDDDVSITKNQISSVISEKVKTTKKSTESKERAGSKRNDRKYHIEKFVVNADMSDADSVSKLMKLLDELDSPEVNPEPA